MEFVVVMKNSGSDNCRKGPPKRATGGNQQVKQSQASCFGSKAVQLAMTNHAEDKQSDAVNAYLSINRSIGSLKQHPANSREGRDQQSGKRQPRIPAGIVKANDEAQEIQRQGKHPQERNDSDVLAHFVGGCEEKQRGTCGQGDPENQRNNLRPRTGRRRNVRNLHSPALIVHASASKQFSGTEGAAKGI